MRGAAMAVGALCATGVHAQSWVATPSVSTEAVGSYNDGQRFEDGSNTQLRLRVSPALRVLALGGGYKLDGLLSGDAYTYLAGGGQDRFLPNSYVNFTGTAIDQWLYLDAGATADTSVRTLQDVVLQDSPSNRRKVFRQRLSPYIDHQFTPSTSLFARSDWTWVQAESNTGLRNYDQFRVESDVARFDVRPEPFGFRLDGSHVRSSGDGIDPDATVFDVVRASALYAPVPSLYFGISGGRDSGSYGGTKTTNTLRGGLMRWAPSDRTLLDASVEQRFFGTGYSARLSHRSPYFVVSSSASRTATTYAMQLAGQTGMATVESLLNAAYTTRYSDPVARLTKVRSELSSLGLSNNILAPAATDATGATRLIQNADVAVMFLGVRHNLLMRVYRQTSETLLAPGTGTGLTPTYTRQVGLVSTLTRRLTPQTNGLAELTYLRANSLTLSGDEVGRTSVSFRMGLTHRLSPQTTGTVGIRRQYSSSTQEGATELRDISVYAGANHRF